MNNLEETIFSDAKTVGKRRGKQARFIIGDYAIVRGDIIKKIFSSKQNIKKKHVERYTHKCEPVLTKTCRKNDIGPLFWDWVR